MVCSRPTTKNGEILYPCGKCPACRKFNAAEWAARLEHESGYHSLSSFITLTYSQENFSKSVSKRHIQLFMKKLRKWYPQKLKYFIAAEYGPKTHRAHYHGIIFGASLDQKTLQLIWKNGFVSVGTVRSESIRYTTNYILTKLYDDPPPGSEVQRVFSLKSHGLGRQWALDNQQQLREEGCIRHRGRECPVPRYYVKLLDLPILAEKQDEKRAEYDRLATEWNKRSEAHDETSQIIMARQQSEKAYLSRYQKENQERNI